MRSNSLPRNLHDLEEEFAQLASEIPEGAQKKALSVLHGIVMEMWRSIERDRASAAGMPMPDAAGRAAPDIADLWQDAPPMEGEAVNEPLPVGAVAPDFALPDASGNMVRLSDFRGRPVVLVFYPLDWSPGCSQQLDLYQQEIDEFEARDAQVLGISVDSIYSHGAWAAARGLTIPLLADFHPKGEVARRYRVWRERDGFSERAIYVIDPAGRIAYRHISPYLHHVPDIYDLLDAVDAARSQRPAEMTA